MANKFTRPFFESSYKFTDPVRVFKENDPYFYKVDNIPIEQLEENIKFLKDQVEGLMGIGSAGSTFEVGRENIAELKPYVDGSNNLVKVKPGRYTARINDAYQLDSLQIINQILGFQFWEDNVYNVKTVNDATLNAILQEFKSATFPVGSNGLVERTFTFPMLNQDTPSPWMLSGEPRTDTGSTTMEGTYPNTYGLMFSHLTDNQVSSAVRSLGLFTNGVNTTYGMLYAARLEADFIKKWRGVARTSIVNVEEELQIEIPAFDEQDFYYISEDGTRTLLDANQRIDLVFIYSKPIDASSTTISKYSGNTPTTLYSPTLGIVKGAGIGIDFRTSGRTTELVNLQDANGIPIMFATPGDEVGENTGIGLVKGSFPSPDDLMNISPLLSENLESDNYALIGQSILPVAYVVVRRTASVTENNISVVRVDDLIDIRPFFRTTELSYNERAGIAAATPQLSIANPVVTEAHLERTTRSIYNDYNTKLNNLRNSLESELNAPNARVVGTGMVRGGLLYGVESVLAQQIAERTGLDPTDYARMQQEIKTRYGGRSAQSWVHPDWDTAEWLNRGVYTQKGALPNDYINFHTLKRKGSELTPNIQEHEGYGCYRYTGGGRVRMFGTDRVTDWANNSDGKGEVALYFCKKRIQIDRSQIPWATDYHVNVQLWNCMPLTCRVNQKNNTVAAGGASIWVDKKVNEFTIYVSWVPRDHISKLEGDPSGDEHWAGQRYPSQNRGDGEEYAGFAVINNDMLTDHTFTATSINGESDCGVAVYPTVTFEVIGIPNQASNINLHGYSPTMTLR